MPCVDTQTKDRVALVAMNREPVNAIEPEMTAELREQLRALAEDDSVGVVILTGAGKLFSFGFDYPTLLEMDRAGLTEFCRDFTALCAELFVFPKPTIAAINGHCLSAGAMLATACDYRIMCLGKPVIGFSELTLSLPLFASTVAMMGHRVGGPGARDILIQAHLYSATEAKRLGWVDNLSSGGHLVDKMSALADQLLPVSGPAMRQIKLLANQPVHEAMRATEPEAIETFVNRWFDPEIRARLEAVTLIG